MRTPKGRGSGSSCLWQWCELNSCPKVWLLWRGNNCQLCYTSAIGCTLFLFFGQRLGEGSFPGFEPGVHWLQGQNSATKLKPCGCTLYINTELEERAWVQPCASSKASWEPPWLRHPLLPSFKLWMSLLHTNRLDCEHCDIGAEDTFQLLASHDTSEVTRDKMVKLKIIY